MHSQTESPGKTLWTPSESSNHLPRETMKYIRYELYDLDGGEALDAALSWETIQEAQAARKALWIMEKRDCEVRRVES